MRTDFLSQGETAEDFPAGAMSDHSGGIIYTVSTPDKRNRERSRFIHENIHFYLDGMLALDTVRTTGRRVPQECFVGLWEVSINLDPRKDTQAFSEDSGYSRHLELNEGATELLNQEIHAAADLGKFKSAGGYLGWVAIFRQMERDGADMTPFIGYKVTDQAVSRANILDRFSWRLAMQDEFSRIYDPRGKQAPHELWEQFDTQLSELTRQIGHTKKATEQYLTLLTKPGWLARWHGRMNRGRNNLFDHPDYAYGAFRRSTFDQSSTT